MNNIYRVKWYNEDGYGEMESIGIIIQGENMTDIEATEKSIEFIKKSISKDYDFNKYEHFRVEKIIAEIISVESSYFC